MQMAAGQILAASAVTASATSQTGAVKAGAAEGTAAAGGFTDMLVHFISGTPGAPQPTASTTPGPVMLASALTGDIMPLLSETKQTDWTALIDELKQMIANADTGQEADSEDVEQLEAMFEQLNALLVSMGLTITHKTADTDIPSEQVNMVHALQGDKHSETSLRSGIHEVLSQLQALFKQGMGKQTEQTFAPMIEQQLQALKQLLVGKAEQNQTVVKSEQDMLDLKGGSVQVTNAAEGSNSQLHRLSHSVFNPILLAKVNSETANQSSATEATAVEADSNPLLVHTATGSHDASRVLHAAPKMEVQPIPVQQFADKMGSFMVKQLSLTSATGFSEAKISLFPEQLGQVDIRITIQNGQLTAHFMTENGLAKDMIENQLSQLRTALQLQGLQVDKLEVTQSSNAFQSQLFQDGRQSNSGQQHTSEQHKSKGERFEDGFEPELVEQAVIHDLGYGRGINVTA
ncbi:flagellar hook-length control protein FliK [Paenibacillus abyssi]|uniref:Flagellar hook-length control protein-like C-terminal domain-containing protein n=1 Tax=Paenibacillus abyssi TaxID=1340531 RepID=A0A917D7S8_9BACL|nr:flagellar hook-length control protein FliK [Paenibacillus abyssi]GGG12383.1 hypothetical protein GCM10010916_31570 [Paenibacillus abyssi]